MFVGRLVDYHPKRAKVPLTDVEVKLFVSARVDGLPQQLL